MKAFELRRHLAVPGLVASGVLFVLFIMAAMGGIASWLICGALGAGVIAVLVVLNKHRLVVDEEGVSTRTPFGQAAIKWDDVSYYTFWSGNLQLGDGVAAQGGLVGVLVGAAIAANERATSNRQFNSGRLKIVANDKQSIVIDSSYHGATGALDLAFAQLHTRLRARPIRDFDPFAFDDTGLTHKKYGTLALAEISKVAIDKGQLKVMKRGKQFSWASEPMIEITNGMLFLDELAERGMLIAAQRDVFIPPTVLDKVRAAATRQAALPVAKVVDRK